MDLERWTDIEVLDCPSVGFRVATALAMTGLVNPDPGPEFTDVYCTLNHCTGALSCGFSLPATSGDLVLSSCPVGELLHKKLGLKSKPRLKAVGA